MTDGPYIAETASLIGDPARANMLSALLGGRAMTASELGLLAGVAPSTASGHLGKLVEGKLISVSSTGRHRYFQLRSPTVASALEQLMALAADGPRRHRPPSRCDEAIARARTCYDHLAGKLGVAIADAMAAREQIVLSEEGGIVTDSGRAFLTDLGVNLEPRKGSRRAPCRACLDWSERRWHIGGLLGAAIASLAFELGWIERQPQGRAISITPVGERAFEDNFGLRLESALAVR